jgi:hypothetical protein
MPVMRLAKLGNSFWFGGRVPSQIRVDDPGRRNNRRDLSMSHKFKVRQTVRLTNQGFSDPRANASNIYEVVRLMPADQTGEVSYRIKSGTIERAVRESEIQNIQAA